MTENEVSELLKYNSTLEAFKKLWESLYNPNSGSPDVCLSDILNGMVKILINIKSNSNFTYEENWIICNISLQPCDIQSLRTDWAEFKTQSIYNSDNVNWDEYDKSFQNHSNVILENINKLLKDEVIFQSDNILYLNVEKNDKR